MCFYIYFAKVLTDLKLLKKSEMIELKAFTAVIWQLYYLCNYPNLGLGN